ncbi:MAG: biopolymer transporter ExbD [Crocinitomicaceae bacterium]|nr:biopolymer transporter ExbD [Crocinitomicaceae bacterium]
MAKRDIPEINAGSMADIAFLLLIFFLVTTTMDRDKAYIKSIPKKIDVPISEPVVVEERDILAIRTNAQNQLMVRGELIGNPDDISDKIIEFYTYNEKANDVTSNFPLYSRVDKATIKEQLRAVEEEYDDVDANGSGPIQEEMLEFINSKIKEWKRKEKAIGMLGTNALSEISSQAHIRVETQKLTGYGLFTKIHSEIEEAVFKLRDDAALRLFNEGYGSIRSKIDNDPDDLVYKDMGSLLDILYPKRVIEVTPK